MRDKNLCALASCPDRPVHRIVGFSINGQLRSVGLCAEHYEMFFDMWTNGDGPIAAGGVVLEPPQPETAPIGITIEPPLPEGA